MSVTTPPCCITVLPTARIISASAALPTAGLASAKSSYRGIVQAENEAKECRTRRKVGVLLGDRKKARSPCTWRLACPGTGLPHSHLSPTLWWRSTEAPRSASSPVARGDRFRRFRCSLLPFDSSNMAKRAREEDFTPSQVRPVPFPLRLPSSGGQRSRPRALPLCR